MLDIRKIKENPDAVKAGLKAKEVDCDAIIDKILELDVQVRGLKTATETKTAQKNKISKEIGVVQQCIEIGIGVESLHAVKDIDTCCGQEECAAKQQLPVVDR